MANACASPMRDMFPSMTVRVSGLSFNESERKSSSQRCFGRPAMSVIVSLPRRIATGCDEGPMMAMVLSEVFLGTTAR